MRGRRKEKKKGKGDAGGGLFEGTAEPRRISPVDIQQKEFRLAMRGYHERDVDEFLDEVTEEVARLYAENKRLQEDLESRARTGGAGAAAATEADAIIRQAHEEAERRLQQAEARVRAMAASSGMSTPAAGPVPAVAGAALASFLTREKSFLQNLAKMMQDHANAMKEDVRRVRQGATRTPAPAPVPAQEQAQAPSSVRTPEPDERPSDRAGQQTSGSVLEEPSSDPSHEMWRTELGSAASEPQPPRQSEQTGQPAYFMDDRSAHPDAGFAAPDDLSPTPVPPGPETGWDETASDTPVPDALPHRELSVDEPTQQWKLEEPPLGADDLDENIAFEPPAEEWTPGDSPAGRATAGGETPHATWVPQPDEEKPEDERSIRELFWGED
jgi:cell division initiation protein